MKYTNQVSLFLAEFIGTALLLFLGCAGCLSWDGTRAALQIPLNFGLVVMALIQMLGSVSGAHLNPVITVAAFTYKLLNLHTAFMYVVAQLLGGFAGFGLLKVLTPKRVFEASAMPDAGHCMVRPHPEMALSQSLAMEFIVCSCLLLIACSVWDPRNAAYQDSVNLRFGLSLTALGISLGPYGVGINPIRTFAPALWYGDLNGQWIYWVGSLSASIVTPFIYRTVFLPHEDILTVETEEDADQTEALNHVK